MPDNLSIKAFSIASMAGGSLRLIHIVLLMSFEEGVAAMGIAQGLAYKCLMIARGTGAMLAKTCWSAIVGAAALLACFTVSAAQVEEALLVTVKRMSLGTAVNIAQAAISACRKEGVQVAVTVVDRTGHPQVVLREALAPDLTLTVSRQKAYTAMSFNASTSVLAGQFSAPFSVAKVAGLVMSAGGLPITAGGALVGGIGVSGAPSGALDERCAAQGIESMQDDLDMAD
jgi:uncharacterized protein GlcG (DUF336 family)